MKKRSTLRQFLTNIYAFTFLNKLTLLTPVYAIFMQDHGVSDMQLATLFILLSVGTFTSQIPVTWVTNKLGQKYAMVLGQWLKIVAFLMWIWWPTYSGFAIGMLIWGIHVAFWNVAFEGMLYDELRARRHQDIYARVLGIRHNVSAVGAALSALGSLLMFAGYEVITYASVAILMLSTLFLLRINLRSVKRTKRTHVRKTRFMTLFRTGVRICVRTPCIFLMMLLTLLVVNINYLDDYLSPIGLEIGMPVMYVGLIQIFILGCTVLGQTFAYRFKRIPDWMLYTTICIAGGGYVLFSIFYSIAGLWLLGMSYVLFAAIFVLLYSRFQDFLPPSYRSVILSLYSIGDNIVYVGTCVLIGFGGTLGSWRYSILMLGAILVGLGLWALLFIRDRCAIGNLPGARHVKTLHPASGNKS